MNNTISVRIYDFLKQFPPFSMLGREALVSIAENVNVLYFEEEEQIFRKGQPVEEQFYIVKDGAVGIYSDNRQRLMDKCDEGDIFGLRALIRRDFYTLCAVTLEESIIYSISSDLLTSVIDNNPNAHEFIQSGFVANLTHKQQPETYETKTPTITEEGFYDAHTASFSTHPVTSPADTTIKDVALLMTEHKVGSVVITENNTPIGIITDKDFRKKIATGEYGINEKVENIMSSPVITRKADITVSEAQITLIKHDISHLCITEDGSATSQLIGVLSEHDIVVMHGNNPSALVKQIKRAQDVQQLAFVLQQAQQLLAAYMEQDMPVAFSSRIMAEINDALQVRTIELSLQESPSPPVSFAWLALGSMGRREQLLITDQDNALVFEDVSYRDKDMVRDYFVRLSRKINAKLHAVGFEFCPADMMARNPKWCLSVDEWKQQFNNWITIPSNDKIMLSTIFFDFDPVYGNYALTDEMTESIYKSISKFGIFLNYLGVNAVQNPPPLSFFRNFLIEDSGEHKHQFDIKARALMPLIDAARLLALSHNLKHMNGTVERYRRLAVLEPQNSDLYHACIDAFFTLQKYRTMQGLAHNDTGRYIELDQLSKADKLLLRASFKPIKAVQELIVIRFKLSTML